MRRNRDKGRASTTPRAAARRAIGLLLLPLGCAGVPTPRSITPEGVVPLQWTAEERAKDIAIRTVRTTEQASFHWVRARGAEKPHVHDHTDMTVFVVSGSVVMHLGEHHIDAAPGDVIEIPRGAPHWVENVDADASVAYVVFTPAFDGQDRRFLDAAQ